MIVGFLRIRRSYYGYEDDSTERAGADERV